MRHLSILLAALAVSIGPAVAQTPPAAQAPPPAAVETPEMFPQAPYREEAFYVCTACHNFKLTAQQGMTREKWAETLEWMTVKHRMPKLEGKELREILDYLSAAFPPRAPAQGGGWKNPFTN